MTSVLLRPVGTSVFLNTDLEPQMVQERTKNSASIYLDSDDPKLELDKTNMLMSTIKTSRDFPNILCQTIKRMRILAGRILYVTPNVNIRNNSIIYYSENTGLTPWNVLIPEGFYTNANALQTAIVAALNTQTADTKLHWSTIPVSNYLNKFELVSAPFPALGNLGGHIILSRSNAVTRGNTLYAFEADTPFTTTSLLGSMMMFYTRYIDICSRRLNNYTKIPSSSTGTNSNIVIRIFVDDPTQTRIVAFEGQSEVAGINFNENDSLSIIDFQLRDQFGDILYIPPGGGTAGQSGFAWDLQILVEI